MNIIKLKYTDKETAIADLITKNVIDEEGNYQQGIQAVVEIGEITIDDIVIDGYYYDVMSEQEIEFENEITVNNPKHTFAGY
jgi:hypothetical protein